jgi:hypothetical protein
MVHINCIVIGRELFYRLEIAGRHCVSSNVLKRAVVAVSCYSWLTYAGMDKEPRVFPSLLTQVAVESLQPRIHQLHLQDFSIA